MATKTKVIKNISIGYDIKESKTSALRRIQISHFLKKELKAKKVLRTQWELLDTSLSSDDVIERLRPFLKKGDELHIAIFSISRKLKISSKK